MTQYTIQGERFNGAAAVVDAFLGSEHDPATTMDEVDGVIDGIVERAQADGVELTTDDEVALSRALAEYYGVTA